MYSADFHTHSLCSPDGSFPMERMALAAMEAGLQEICFTDHWDLLDYRGNFCFTYDWNPVRAQFAEAVARCGEKIRIRFGIELGEAPESFESADRGLQAAPELDFVICSIHNMGSAYHGGKDFYFSDYKKNLELCFEHLDLYFPKLLSCAAWGNFDALGHLTYPLRYMRDRDGQKVTFDRYAAQIDELFRTLAGRGKALELNVNRGGDISEQLAIFRHYKACGGEFVTVGSDAHKPEHVGKSIREGYELLREAGFRYVTRYEKRKPEQIKL
jgi:histidinol-phosphatase (PHP family)